MPEKQDTVFADGLFFELPVATAPSFVKGRLSIKVQEFIQFLQKHENVGGFVNIKLNESKGQKGYAVLDTWKPNQTIQKQGEAPTETVTESIEYPEEQINPEDIPF